MATLFISDLHLAAERRGLIEFFEAFLETRVSPGDTLYILGDLFEVWYGDDAATADQRRVQAAMRARADTGTEVRVMHGNRDFLMGAAFAEATGCRLIPDPSVIYLGDEPILLMHGDSLCTDDVEYQAFKARVREPAFQAQFLAMPVAQRRAIAQSYRAESAKNVRRKPMDIMDVNAGAVIDTMREHGVRRLIHGHTHRQAIHELSIDGKRAERIVLGDWDEIGCVLVHDGQDLRLENFDADTLRARRTAPP